LGELNLEKRATTLTVWGGGRQSWGTKQAPDPGKKNHQNVLPARHGQIDRDGKTFGDFFFAESAVLLVS
jgi:hypothetical protein